MTGQGVKRTRPCTSVAVVTSPRRPAGLLEGHVRRSADGAERRQFGGGRALEPLGRSEVGQMRLTAGIKQDVGRFEVAMEHAALVGMAQRLRDRGHEPRRPRGRSR